MEEEIMEFGEGVIEFYSRESFKLWSIGESCDANAACPPSKPVDLHLQVELMLFSGLW